MGLLCILCMSNSVAERSTRQILCKCVWGVSFTIAFLFSQDSRQVLPQPGRAVLSVWCTLSERWGDSSHSEGEGGNRICQWLIPGAILSSMFQSSPPLCPPASNPFYAHLGTPGTPGTPGQAPGQVDSFGMQAFSPASVGGSSEQELMDIRVGF